MKIKAFLSLILLLSCRESIPKTAFRPTESWFGVYLANKKVGYSVTKSQIIPDGYQIISRTKMSLKMMEQQSEINSNFIAITDSALTLKSFDMDFVTKGSSFRVKGKRINSKFEVTVKSGGETKTNVLDVGGKIYPAAVIGNIVTGQGLKLGKTYDLRIFEPTVMNAVDTKVIIQGQERIKVKNQEYDAWRLNITILGLTQTTWIDSTGETIKEESPPGIVMIRETPQEALAEVGESQTLDVLSLFSIRVDSTMPNPRETFYLKVVLKDIDTTNLSLSDESQKITGTNPLVLEIKSESKPVEKINLPIGRETEFTRPSLAIQSDNPKIKDKAQSIIQDSKDATAAVEKLVNWVFNNVEKRATASLPSAIDVLANMVGDCNEHSVLFAALARAVGIPTKVVVGIVYLDNAFYYHAWNKVYLGKWIAVDPTFNQFPADATHIKLQEGELSEQAKVLKIVGTVKIEIKEFR